MQKTKNTWIEQSQPREIMANLLDRLSPLDRAMLILCACRLDPKCDADQFIELLDSVVSAAKNEAIESRDGTRS